MWQQLRPVVVNKLINYLPFAVISSFWWGYNSLPFLFTWPPPLSPADRTNTLICSCAKHTTLIGQYFTLPSSMLMRGGGTTKTPPSLCVYQPLLAFNLYKPHLISKVKHQTKCPLCIWAQNAYNSGQVNIHMLCEGVKQGVPLQLTHFSYNFSLLHGTLHWLDFFYLMFQTILVSKWFA